MNSCKWPHSEEFLLINTTAANRSWAGHLSGWIHANIGPKWGIWVNQYDCKRFFSRKFLAAYSYLRRRMSTSVWPLRMLNALFRCFRGVKKLPSSLCHAEFIYLLVSSVVADHGPLGGPRDGYQRFETYNPLGISWTSMATGFSVFLVQIG